MNFYSHPWCSSTQNVYTKQYDSHLKSSHVLFIIMYYLHLKRGVPQSHHNVHTVLVTIGHTVQKFKCYRQTHKVTRTAWWSYDFGFKIAWISGQPVTMLLALPYCLFVSVRLSCWPFLPDVIGTSYIWRLSQRCKWQFPSNNNMADMRIWEAVATQ